MIRQAVFLAGGRGTRLGALAADCPKPLLEVAGRPFLEHLMARAAWAGIDRILLLAGHLGEQVRARYDGRELGGARVEVLVEPEARGTGGALAGAAGRLDDRFMMGNGDSLFDFDLPSFLAHPPAEPWTGFLALRWLADAGRAGVVDIEGERITGFRPRGEAGRPGLANGGVYLLDRAIMERVDHFPLSLEQDVFPRLAGEGRLAGRVLEGDFIDIGVPEDLERARRPGTINLVATDGAMR